MQLAFLGQTYTAAFTPVKAIETTETATFLGKRYAQKQFNYSQCQQPTAELTYRGVRYGR